MLELRATPVVPPECALAPDLHSCRQKLPGSDSLCSAPPHLRTANGGWSFAAVIRTQDDDMRFPGWSAVTLLGLTALLATSALARDDGRFANSPLKPWFESLRSEYGQCCSDADGYVVADVDWESAQGHFRVHIDDEWVVVPDGAVITEPNRVGRTMVWKHYIDGHPRVRCFMPGSMT